MFHRPLLFAVLLLPVLAHAGTAPTHASTSASTVDGTPAYERLEEPPPAQPPPSNQPGQPQAPRGELFPPESQQPTWKPGQLPEAARETHRWRALGEMGLFLVPDWTLLWFTSPAEADPPGNVSVWSKLSGKAITFDTSAFSTNFVFHPFAGRFYYGIARSNGLGPLESLGWTFGAASVWEVFEFPENFSINDVLMTTFGGVSLGESMYHLAAWVDARHYGWGADVLTTIIALPLRLNSWLDHAPMAIGPIGVLSGHVTLMGGAVTGHGGNYPTFGLELATRMVQDHAYGQPGRGVDVATGNGATEIGVRATTGPRGIADFRLSASTWMATLYDRKLTRSASGELQGFDLLEGLGPGYVYRVHDWRVDGPFDTFALVEVPGVFAEVRDFHGPFRLSGRLDVSLDFGGSHSLALAIDRAAVPFATLPTPTRAFGYAFGWGPGLGASLSAGMGPATVSAAARVDALKGITARDVWPGRHPTADLGDRWTDLSAQLGYQLPWYGLELSATALRQLRSGHAGTVEHTLGQTQLLFAVGVAGP